ncbi:MAG: hypothetical protein WBQ37_05710 [Candidatus Competibacter sp.]
MPIRVGGLASVFLVAATRLNLLQCPARLAQFDYLSQRFRLTSL